MLSRPMLNAVFQHLATTPNVGDRACSPARYFDWGDKLVQDYGQTVPATKLAIFGGGQTFRQAAHGAVFDALAAQHRIIWGIGISSRQRARLEFDMMADAATLISSRVKDTPGCRFVPCVSAMAHHFDAPPQPRHAVVLFWHHTKSQRLQRPDTIPALSNHGSSLATSLDFIASGETVVTNSYHGTYWAMCLGRKVLCLPFSDKFTGFLDDPETASADEWPAHLSRARRHPEILDHARAANRAFHADVMAL